MKMFNEDNKKETHILIEEKELEDLLRQTNDTLKIFKDKLTLYLIESKNRWFQQHIKNGVNINKDILAQVNKFVALVERNKIGKCEDPTVRLIYKDIFKSVAEELKLDETDNVIQS